MAPAGKAGPKAGSKGSSTAQAARRPTPSPARVGLNLATRTKSLGFGRAVTVDHDEITCRAYILYGILYLFAEWFGARHFDANGDGQFDARDVQHAHNRLGRMLRISFSAPTFKRTRKAQKRRGVVKPPGGDAPPDQSTARPQRPSDGSIASMENIERVMEEIIGGSQVVGDMSQEELVSEHLRQFYPWFCICMTLVILGLWVGYAAQQDVYTRTAINAQYQESWVVKSFGPGEKNRRECELECSRMESCAGYSYDYMPEAECVLLNEVQPSDGTCGGSSDMWCGVYHYEKSQMSLEGMFTALGGLELAYPGATSLSGRSYCEDGIEFEAWRLVSYQLSHVGLQHALFNCLLILLFGIPLEGTLGTKRMACLWTMGVIGGGLAWMVWDAHMATVGASGGCYALIGMHLADTFMNWRVKRFRYLTLLICLLVLGIEALMSLASTGTSTTSHSVHGGGLIMGLLAGVVFGLDLDGSRGAMICKLVTLFVGCCMLAFVLIWWFASNEFPATKSILEEEAYCWLGQVCLAVDGEATCAYSCVRCVSRDCVESWYSENADGEINKAVYGTAVATATICDEIGFAGLERAP